MIQMSEDQMVKISCYLQSLQSKDIMRRTSCGGCDQEISLVYTCIASGS